MLVKGNGLLIQDVRSILLIQLGDIGDVVLSLPCVRALRENFPKANVIVAVREKARELMEDCPWAKGVVSVNQERRRLDEEIRYQKEFFLGLRRFNFDLVIDLRTGTRGAILAFLSGARQRIGRYADDGKLWRNRVFTHLTLPEGRLDQHVADYYFDILASYDLTTENARPELDIQPEKELRAAAIFRGEKIPLDRPIIAVQPFSLWQYKEWGIDKYIELIDRIRSKYKLSIVITGSPDERARAAEIIKMRGENVHNLAGKTSLGVFAAVLKACTLFIGGDSAGMHLSAAVGTPTVSIFGPSSPACWAPKGTQHAVACKDFRCVPCKEKGCGGTEISRCLKELTVDEVMCVVNGQMDKILRV
jgi:heptosyltransferase-3